MIAEYIADKRYIAFPGKNGVVSREVGCPQETLLTQLDGRREEAEHGYEQRHLQQHGQTPAHWAHTHFIVESHRCLLAFHGFFRWDFSIYFVNLGFQNPHFGARHVGFVTQRKQYEFNDNGHNQDNDTETAYKPAQNIEHRNYKVLVYPSEDQPAERNEFAKIEFFIAWHFFIVS